MSSEDKFKKFLKSGTFSRWTRKHQTRTVENTAGETSGLITPPEPEPVSSHVWTSDIEFEADPELNQEEDSDFDLGDWSPEENSSDESEDGRFDEDDPGIDEEQPELESLTTFMRNWSLEFNISHQALQPLLQRLNQIDSSLPESPRRLLQTPRKRPILVEIGGGKYWHQGFGNNFDTNWSVKILNYY